MKNLNSILFNEKIISKAVILDFDLHYGDGTDNIFIGDPDVSYLHPEANRSEVFLEIAEEELESSGQRDVLAVSAGFDRGKNDWGDLLNEADYQQLGQITKDYAEKNCKGHRYALLEGGYNHSVLGKHVKAFLVGFS